MPHSFPAAPPRGLCPSSPALFETGSPSCTPPHCAVPATSRPGLLPPSSVRRTVSQPSSASMRAMPVVPHPFGAAAARRSHFSRPGSPPPSSARRTVSQPSSPSNRSMPVGPRPLGTGSPPCAPLSLPVPAPMSRRPPELLAIDSRARMLKVTFLRLAPADVSLYVPVISRVIKHT
ncbi:hypothetical protein B0H19DRAFT_1257529 [Mycena capillaripes]|nr:hypothetical protein B0H19DRAFT_1257529 [Mycena capillaripes]